jgi:acyl-CoA dehydrogenase
MIIYGQGAIRCHPFVRDVMESAAARDLARFDRAFSGHIGFVLSNVVRAIVLGVTGGRPARPVAGVAGPYLGHLSRLSAAFVVVSDAAMAMLGGDLKRREKISGRLADALAWMYLASATVKHYWDEGQPEGDVPFLRWSCTLAIHHVQEALRGVLDNLPSRPAASLLRPIVFPLGARHRPPDDALGGALARALLDDREERRRLTRDIFIPAAEEPGLGHLEWALAKAAAAHAVEEKLKGAVRAGRLPRETGDALVHAAFEAGVLTAEERECLSEAAAAREESIRVDAFPGGPVEPPARPSMEPVTGLAPARA